MDDTEPADVPPSLWLSPEEQAAWSGMLQMHAQLSGLLGRALTDGGAGLSLADYAVLVELTARPDGRMRPFEIGRALGWEKSRLSHHLARMTTRRLVARERCPSDQRGLVVAVTTHGRRMLERAAPAHVAAVRRVFVDRLTPEQLAQLADIARTVVAGLADECGGPDPGCETDGCGTGPAPAG